MKLEEDPPETAASQFRQTEPNYQDGGRAICSAVVFTRPRIRKASQLRRLRHHRTLEWTRAISSARIVCSGYVHSHVRSGPAVLTSCPVSNNARSEVNEVYLAV